MSEWLAIAARRSVRNRALKVGLIVGTILTLINQGDVLISGTITAVILSKILLTYCVPYCVSTYAAVQAIRDH